MTVSSLTWESPYLGKTVFILRWGPEPYQNLSAIFHYPQISSIHIVCFSCWDVIKLIRTKDQLARYVLAKIPKTLPDETSRDLGLSWGSSEFSLFQRLKADWVEDWEEGY